MKIAAIIGLAALFVFLGVQIKGLYGRGVELKRELANVQEELTAREKEYAALEADYEYYKNPANLEKELRARFNYRLPDETMIVIVPKPSSSNSSSSQ